MMVSRENQFSIPMADSRHTNRREFLQGEAARKALENFAEGYKHQLPQRELPATTVPPSSYLLQLTRDAMAVQFQVHLNAGEFDEGPEAALAALDLLEPLEAQMTVYRETSEVCQINRLAYAEPFGVEPRLFRVFALAQTISQETAGCYDMTSGPLSKLWGFYRRQGRMPSPAEIAATLPSVGYEKITLDASASTIRFAVPNMELNLGGIGKGYALDCLSQHLRLQDVESFLIHGGQSSVLAHGSRLGASQPGWSVGLAHPLRPETRLAEFQLVNQALGTSGSGTQFFHHQGKKYGHLLDPRTGMPAEGVLSCTVIARTAAEADALSTAFYVGGLALARDYCEQHPEVAALLVTPGTKTGTLELHPVNLAEDAWRNLLAS
jgi:thiamine biosynthesis lipoprotein